MTIYETANESDQYHAVDIDALSEQQSQELVKRICGAFTRHLRAVRPLSDCDLSVRALNVLRRIKVTSLHELSSYQQEMPSAGVCTMREFAVLLDEAGMVWPACMQKGRFSSMMGRIN